MSGYLQLSFYIAALIFILTGYLKNAHQSQSFYREYEQSVYEEFNMRACYSHYIAKENLNSAETLYRTNFNPNTSDIREQIEMALKLQQEDGLDCSSLPGSNHPTISNNSAIPYNWVLNYE